jgi:hypothetical protein
MTCPSMIISLRLLMPFPEFLRSSYPLTTAYRFVLALRRHTTPYTATLMESTITPRSIYTSRVKVDG